MAEIWGAIAVGAGVAANVYGASQQRKANAAAQDQNARLQQEQNSAAWSNYLLSRGISPTVQLAPGQMPTAGQYQVTNAKLPLWANVNLNQLAQPNSQSAARQPFLIKRGA